MKILPDTSRRSNQPELMDDQELQERELAHILRDLHKVNSLLGGYKITWEGIQKIFGSGCFAQPVAIVDVGCGDGNMLKYIARMGRSSGIKMKLKGIDINEKSLRIAQKNTEDYPEISYEKLDISTDFEKLDKTDIIVCTLTLHHFTDLDIQSLLRKFSEVSTMGVVINDLHRSKWAYFLFSIFSAFFLKNSIAKKDGQTSILRAFKRKDLERYGQGLSVRKQILSWKWAFRYQWIILK